MGQSGLHHALCQILYAILTDALGEGSFVASDLFVFYDPSDNRKKCAPDAFVKLGTPSGLKDVWCTWKDGIPELAIEILSPSDREKLPLEEKLARYSAIGVREVVTYDPLAPFGHRVRAWDRRADELVERGIEGERTECVTLGMWFVLAPALDAPSSPMALRLARDPEGAELVPTPREVAKLANEAKERERVAKERERVAKERERVARERERVAKEAAIAAERQAEARERAALAEV